MDALKEIAEMAKNLWRPIESAPKDGSPILTWQESVGVRMSHWDNDYARIRDGDGWVDCDEHYYPRKPVAWMPLPDGPAVIEE